MADPILKTYAGHAIPHFERAGASLALRQAPVGALRGSVAPWPGCADPDFHGTLASVWVWSRHQGLAGDARFAANRAAAWSFVEAAWDRFIPEAIGPEAASDEAAYDCALVLRAAVAERGIEDASPARAALVGRAARVLAAHLADLDDLSGRDFLDPGFAAWSLIDHARSVEDRGLLASGRRFVERAFGMKAPPPFLLEPESPGRLFDFSSTTATRVLAIISSEGNTPFVGAWLRERVVTAVPAGWTSRTLDENCWNACVAAMLGRAYVVSTDPLFLDRYRVVSAELARRSTLAGGGLGRGGASPALAPSGPDTLATFYHALATDALVRLEAEVYELGAHNGQGRGHGR